MPAQEHKLAITLLGPANPIVLQQLIQRISDSGCSIQDSHVRTLANHYTAFMLITGSWGTLAKLENSLDKLCMNTDFVIHKKQVQDTLKMPAMLPYGIDLVAQDKPGIANKIMDFILSRDMLISDMVTQCYQAVHTHTTMFSLRMNIHIPVDTQLALLREEFIDFCDQHNLDAVMEPVKN